ncbi:MAG: hypothetical protein LBE08_01520 [Bifidobacteriaceae bacterium]|nr:hypothetical protein [Bifidobacteriaceae bacterium]
MSPAAAWAAGLNQLAAAKKLLVALDFDGTLAPLTADPQAARVLPASAVALRRLAALPGVVLALVSGRPAADLARLARPPVGTYLVGSHGAERGTARAGGRALIDPVELSDTLRARLELVTTQLEELAQHACGGGCAATPTPAAPAPADTATPAPASTATPTPPAPAPAGTTTPTPASTATPAPATPAPAGTATPTPAAPAPPAPAPAGIAAPAPPPAGTAGGAWVEHKPFAAVFHTRPMADRAAAAELEAQAALIGSAAGAHVLPGKMVVEVAVLPAGKAAALTQLKTITQADRLVFAGDDLTDELALNTINPPDLGIKIGPGRTAAALRLPDPPALAEFLQALAAARE